MQKLGKSQVLLILQGELRNKFKDDLYILPLDKIGKKIDMMLSDVKDALLQHFNCGHPSEDLLLQLSKNFNFEQKDIENMFVSFKKHIEIEMKEIEISESVDRMLKHTKNELITWVKQVKDPKYTGQGDSRRERFPASSIEPLKGTDILP